MSFISAIGSRVIQSCEKTGYAVNLFIQTIYWLKAIRYRARSILEQMFVCGVQTFSVTIIVGIFTGMILALQTGITLKDYHLEHLIGVVILETLCRELGPFMTAFILAGRAGSAMAAEIGTMKVSEEIDALEVMSINPVSFLVMPRVIALALFAPILTAYVNIVGLIGGSIVANYQIGVDFSVYFREILNQMQVSSFKLVFAGLFKGWVFGMVIAIVSCANGLKAKDGAAGVGIATRQSVVDAFLLILIFNYFMSNVIEKVF